ncbi:MAG: Gfo/Idh/MocA family oxidoreductase [Lentisphaerae bacterium]|jgi:predicted dehydrogenase|nr:Gfo/Idh/MocA family oxidoreductase [Lentisphaerota bacterium]MBT4815561.1 Gfo/Idh/MocA family oxidoreductase [Lentisphaerota bacterium]MBT5613206.1 Gfo/Idh/MocA family oxidoreductase [Lentisphaerota bacterium]MBT7062131.1 Gfo/Idh/MocA family oxidoreductase [Lentisphaerota bacterium]MBT7847643.1 Gfo/Idh/MocA family oxidoreductase [Lentisphaerota bacterium]
MSNRIRYGIIGAGGCGRGKHLTSYSQMPEVDIIAVCDIIPERAEAAADQFDAEESYTDYVEMLHEEDLDLVSVATPNHVHAPATVAALDAGCHVHCEKPASLTPGLVQSMVDAKERAGKHLMIGLNNRFTPWAQFARTYVDAGHLGDIYHAKCGWKRRRGIPGKGGWFTTKAQSGGGPLIDLGVHFIDVCNYIMGFPTPTSASGQTYSKFADHRGPSAASSKKSPDPATGFTYDVEDLAVGFVRYENGCTLELEFSWASNIAHEVNFVELYGTRGGLEYRHGELTLYGEFEGTSLDTSPKIKGGGAWGLAETKHYVDVIQNGGTVMSPPEEAVLIMKIIEGIYASAEQDAEVRLTQS